MLGCRCPECHLDSLSAHTNSNSPPDTCGPGSQNCPPSLQERECEAHALFCSFMPDQAPGSSTLHSAHPIPIHLNSLRAFVVVCTVVSGHKQQIQYHSAPHLNNFAYLLQFQKKTLSATPVQIHAYPDTDLDLSSAHNTVPLVNFDTLCIRHSKA